MNAIRRITENHKTAVGCVVVIGLLVSGRIQLVANPPAAALSQAANYIQIENAKPGSSEWKLTNPGYASGAIEGYASLTSVDRGGQIKLFVNTTAATYTLDVFRMGYYQGLGGRRMLPTVSLPGTLQPQPITDPATGLIECDWSNPYVLSIPRSADPTDWMSGIYLVKLTAGASGKQQYIVFTVRDDARQSDIILAQTVNTYHAYNVWGGKSLYGTVTNRTDTANAAHKVSFNRPYYGDESNGAGQFTSWEFGMVKWLEAEGYDVSYATNVDVDAIPNLLSSHRGFLSVGHDEYWSWNMRDHVEAARGQGVNLGFFSGNTSYWQVRYEPSVINGEPSRTLVGYKEAWKQDPITPDYLKTTEWRYAPVNRSEDAMLGVRYITQAKPILVIEDASSWVFSGTGLHNGDRLAKPDGTAFLGYEVDAMGPFSPADTQRLAHSPANAKAANFSDMTVYRAASGATVFATGSIGWSETVPQVQQITRNVLARFTQGAFNDTTPIRPLLPPPFAAGDVGDVGRAGFVSLADTQSFTLNGAGQNAFTGKDALYYAYQQLSGDGEITARLTALQLFWNNRAGLMIRESLSPDARYVALVGRPSESTGAVNEGVEFWTRSQVGVKRSVLGSRDMDLPNWLRLTRSGDTFAAAVSSDGIDWIPVGSATVPMNTDVYIGAEVSSAQYGVWATASFDHVSVSAGGSSPPRAPSVTVTAPPTGAVVTVGTPYTIKWTVAPADWPIARIDVRFAAANTPTGATETICENLPGAATQCQWSSPGPVTDNGHIYVAATDQGGHTGTGDSGRFSIQAASGGGGLPGGWSQSDIGAVGAAGNSSYDGSVLTITGSGADIWGTADEFHYAWTPFTGSFEINARVDSLQNVNPWTKAGIMMRENALDPASPHASIFVTPGKGVAFQRRTSEGGTSVHTAGPAITAPLWLRMVRDKDLLSAYYRKNLTDPWILVGRQPMTGIPATADIGVAVTSHADGVGATAAFSNLSVAALPAWSEGGRIGTATGSAMSDFTTFTLNGSGADIWSTSDGCYFVANPLSGNGTITARVLSIENTHAWAKAGVMIRESLAAESKQVDTIVSFGKGLAMQYRNVTSGTTANAALRSGTAPGWVQLTRNGDTFTGRWSSDGVNWSTLGSTTVAMSATVYIGLAVTSHNPSTEATGVFDDVRIAP